MYNRIDKLAYQSNKRHKEISMTETRNAISVQDVELVQSQARINTE